MMDHGVTIMRYYEIVRPGEWQALNRLAWSDALLPPMIFPPASEYVWRDLLQRSDRRK